MMVVTWGCERWSNTCSPSLGRGEAAMLPWPFAAYAVCFLLTPIMGQENIVAQINVDCTEAETLLETFLFVIFQG